MTYASKTQKSPAIHPPAKTMHFIAEKQIPFRPCSKSSVFVGRQPIYAKDDSSFGYELLFRSSFTNEANIEDGQKATAELLINTFAEIGLERIVGSLPAFINVSEEFIVNQHCHFLPKDKVVIEVLENVKPTREVMLALSDLKREGYTVALDDFVYSECLKPMLELADIVKIDVSVFENAADLKKQIEHIKPFEVKLLAEKIESVEEYNNCKDLGFERIILKNGKMRCFFVENPQSLYYETEFFKKLFDFIVKDGYKLGLKFKQSPKNLIIIKEGISNLKSAKSFLDSLQEGRDA